MSRVLFENDDILLIESENSFVFKSKNKKIRGVYDCMCDMKYIVVKKGDDSP